MVWSAPEDERPHAQPGTRPFWQHAGWKRALQEVFHGNGHDADTPLKSERCRFTLIPFVVSLPNPERRRSTGSGRTEKRRRLARRTPHLPERCSFTLNKRLPQAVSCRAPNPHLP